MNSGIPWADIAIAVLAAAALFVSLRALRVAKRSNELVGVYKRAIWTIAAAHTETDAFFISLTNNGESPARDVSLTLDSDPLHTLGGAERIPLVAAGETVRINITIPNWPNPVERGMATLAWSSYFGQDERRRLAEIAWDDLEDERRAQVVALPAVLIVD